MPFLGSIGRAFQRTVINPIKHVTRHPARVGRSIERRVRRTIRNPAGKVLNELTGRRKRNNRKIDEARRDQIQAARKRIHSARALHSAQIKALIEKEVEEAIGLLSSGDRLEERGHMTLLFKAFLSCEQGEDLAPIQCILNWGYENRVYHDFFQDNPIEEAYSGYQTHGRIAAIELLVKHNIEYAEILLNKIETDLNSLSSLTEDSHTASVANLTRLKSALEALQATFLLDNLPADAELDRQEQALSNDFKKRVEEIIEAIPGADSELKVIDELIESMLNIQERSQYIRPDNFTLEGFLASFPVHLAARHGKIAILSQFRQMQLPLNRFDIDGNTPLHCAAIQGQQAAIEYLITQGLSFGQKNRAGQTILDCLQMGGHIELFSHYQTVVVSDIKAQLEATVQEKNTAEENYRAIIALQSSHRGLIDFPAVEKLLSEFKQVELDRSEELKCQVDGLARISKAYQFFVQERTRKAKSKVRMEILRTCQLDQNSRNDLLDNIVTLELLGNECSNNLSENLKDASSTGRVILAKKVAAFYKGLSGEQAAMTFLQRVCEAEAKNHEAAADRIISRQYTEQDVTEIKNNAQARSVYVKKRGF